jgi:hypothetical protein
MSETEALTDPLVGFPWTELFSLYDDACRGFDATAGHLEDLPEKQCCDRRLYYVLLDRFRVELSESSGLRTETYRAMLYWKHYSSGRRRAELLCDRVVKDQDSVGVALQHLSNKLRRPVERIPSVICELVESLGKYKLPGMAASSSLPTRTTFLHFAYPSVVPIFDSQALKSFDILQDCSNLRSDLLSRYIDSVYQLSDKHALLHPKDARESHIRITEMALWVLRGKPSKLASPRPKHVCVA